MGLFILMEPEKEILATVSIQEYLRLMRRRRTIIIQTFVIISVVGILATELTKPVYQATAKLLVEGPSLRMDTVDTANPLSALFALGQEQTVETQVEVLQARPLLDKLEQEVGHADLKVSEINDTNVIEVSSEATNPRVAADAANKLLSLYLDENSDQNLVDIQSAKKFVASQGDLAKNRLSIADAQLTRFKQQHALTNFIKDRDDQIDSVTALQSDYQKSSTELAAILSQLATDRKLLNQEQEVSSIRLNSSNPSIAAIQDDIQKLEITRAGMNQPGGYTSQSPQVRAIDGQIAEMKRNLSQQPALISDISSTPNAVREATQEKIADLESQAGGLTSQTAADQRSLAQAEAKVRNFAEWEVTYAHMLRSRDDAVAAVTMFGDKLTDLSLREQAHHNSARIIESARPPIHPIRPKKLLNILLTCLLGLFAGGCLALLQEYLDDRINTEEEAGRLLGLTPLGRVPTLSTSDAGLLVRMQGLDPISESYRVLRTNIHFASIDKPLHTLQITSSAPGEGKTTTAANLAFAMVMDGKKVILVDTDLRRPAVHKLLELPSSPGLINVLLGEITLEDALASHKDLPGLMTLVAGAMPPNPAELLGSRAFHGVVEQLKTLADLVIFDSPPVLVAADAQILAAQMDGVVMVVEINGIKKTVASRALSLLRQAHANILGAAYNKMRTGGPEEQYYYQYTPLRTDDNKDTANDTGKTATKQMAEKKDENE